ncbi:hypothetical protein [Apilactobacillus xinyiensis]|uniref:hypothetical protein n=1 Tax=Apilactobacillus xinyiensis TaxID=2841032 RepID=UPI00200CFB57|nr:hypothetical protein [Apilactobacillus xinyiensis]MCL0318600.1 hypothetical protein [Apilactobacillus xinyiensis]
MFSNDIRKEADANLKKSVNDYKERCKISSKLSAELYSDRQGLKSIINDAYNFINLIKNKPSTMANEIQEVKINVENFDATIYHYQKEIDANKKQSSETAGAGVLAGLGVATLAPGIAMGLVTTFGTASTGVAISTLSGAAATNAALAALGGGALTAGGAGMAGGDALLALAGPIGWAIGGAALIGGGLLFNKKNKEIAEKMNKESQKIKNEIYKQTLISKSIRDMCSLTKKDSLNMRVEVDSVQSYPKEYLDMSDDQKLRLGSFVNNLMTSSAHLNMVINDDYKFVNKSDSKNIC